MRVRLFLVLFVLGTLLPSFEAQAQKPHEVLLLVNKNSEASLKVANFWAMNRQIPGKNILRLDIPKRLIEKSATITPDEFAEFIWNPANEALKAREIDQRILAWVYSVDFPIRVKTDKSDRKQMSVSGLTFLRNKLPDLQEVEDGGYHSKIFAGPNAKFPYSLPGISLGIFRDGFGKEAKLPDYATYLREGLQEKMPLPSMMLGYVGEKGNSVDEVLSMIERGKASDYRGLINGLYFITGEDVRAKCRMSMFLPTVQELQRFKFKINITTNFPAGAEHVMGLMMGAETVDPSQIKSFAPGAVADHLTSWSAEFQKPQTKLTEWVRAGASGTSGTVVEPYSNPNKFPSARFFAIYASGCTMLESFYQTIACPLQNLIIGDPLAKPYAAPIGLKILGANMLTHDFTYVANPTTKIKRKFVYEYDFMLDGKDLHMRSDDPSCFIRIDKLSDGYHELSAAAYFKYTIEYCAFATKEFFVDRLGRSITIRQEMRRVDDFSHGIKVDIGGYEDPQTIRLVCGELVLNEKPYEEDIELILDERNVGEGPNRVRVIGVFEDGMEVSSTPVSFMVQYKKQ